MHQFRQAYELDRTDLGQFSEEPRDRALRRSVQNLDRIALGEARSGSSRSRGNVADRIERTLGLAAEPLLPPPQELPYRNDGYGDFVLSVNRLDRAKRIDLLLEAAALDPVAARRDRGRRPRPRAARVARARARADGRAELRRPRRRGRADLALRHAASPSTTRPSTRTTGWSPTRRSCAEKPVAHDDGRGVAARGAVEDGRTGLVTAPRRGRDRRGVRAGCASTRRGEAYGRAGRESRERVTWDTSSRGCSREGRLLLAAAAGAVGDRRLQRAPPARARASASTSSRSAAGGRVPPGRATSTSALYHVGNNPDAHGWIVDALRKRAGRRRPARLRPPPPRRRAHDRPRRRARLPRRDGAGGRRRRPAARPRRARQADPAALGEPARGLPPRRRGARPRNRADRPLALRRAAGARGRLRRPDLADPASGLEGTRRSRRLRSRAAR